MQAKNKNQDKNNLIVKRKGIDKTVLRNSEIAHMLGLPGRVLKITMIIYIKNSSEKREQHA